MRPKQLILASAMVLLAAACVLLACPDSAWAQDPPPEPAPDAPPAARGLDVAYTWSERMGVHSNPTRGIDSLAISSAYLEHGIQVEAKPRDRTSDRRSLDVGIAFRDFLESSRDFDSVEASLAGLMGMRARYVSVDATLGGTRTSEAIDVQGVSDERLSRDTYHVGVKMTISFRDVDLSTTAVRTRLLYDRGDLRALNHSQENLTLSASFETSRLTAWTMGVSVGRTLYDRAIQNDGESTTFTVGQRVKSAESASWSWNAGVTTVRIKPTGGVPLDTSTTVGTGGLDWETGATRWWRVSLGTTIEVELAQGNGFRRNVEVHAASAWDLGKTYSLEVTASQLRSKPSTTGAIVVRTVGTQLTWNLGDNSKLEASYALDQREADGTSLDYTASIVNIAFVLVF